MRYVHNLFEGDGKHHYREEIKNIFESHEDAKRLLIAKLTNINKQNPIPQYLQSLEIKNIMEKEACNTSEALEKIRDTITKYATEGPFSYQSQEVKIEYLYNAVSINEWARVPLRQCFAKNPPWNSHQLFTALDKPWLQEQRQNCNKVSISNEPVDILRKSPRFDGSPQQNPISKKAQCCFNLAKTKNICCYRCNGERHHSWRCTKPKNIARIVLMTTIKYPNKNSHIRHEL